MTKTAKRFATLMSIFLFAAWVIAPASAIAETRKIYGLGLPPYAKEIAKGRYSSNQKFFKKHSKTLNAVLVVKTPSGSNLSR